MTSSLKAIVAIWKKDVLALWPVIAAAAGLAVLSGIYKATAPNSGTYDLMGMLLSMIAVVASVLALVIGVQQDPPLGERHDWRTRPIRRLDLILAKHLFVVPAVILPWLARAVIVDVAAGYSLAEILAPNTGGFGTIALLPIVIAFAATAETFVGFLVMVGVTTVGAIAGLWIFNGTIVASLGRALFVSPLTDWSTGLILLVLFLVAGIGLLWLAFTRHKAWLSRGAFLLAVFAVVTISAYALPSDAVWAAYRSAAPRSEVASGITGRLETCVRPRLAAGRPPNVIARAMFEGVQPNQRLFVEQSDAELSTTHGHGHRVTSFSNTLSEGGRLVQPLMLSMDSGEARVVQAGSTSARVTSRLTLLEETGRFRFRTSAIGKRQSVPGFGWCGLTDSSALDCFKPGEQPDLIIFTNADGSAPCRGCKPNYKPAWLEAPVGRRYQVFFPAGKEGGEAMAITYRVATRFEQVLTAPVSGATCPASPK